jgi:hypothetical protein
MKLKHENIVIEPILYTVSDSDMTVVTYLAKVKDIKTKTKKIIKLDPDEVEFLDEDEIMISDYAKQQVIERAKRALSGQKTKEDEQIKNYSIFYHRSD